MLNYKDLSYSSVNEYIRAARFFLSIRQEDLAKACGISRQTLISIEKGQSDPGTRLSTKILKYLNDKGAPKYDLYNLQSPVLISSPTSMQA